MPNAPAAGAPVTHLYSYAHEDEPLRDELEGPLKILERRGLIAPWHDRQITAGNDWNAAIHHGLTAAELVLLLISKDFISSDYIFSTELKVAMERRDQGKNVVVPVFVRAVDLQPEDAEAMPFLKLQGLPQDLRPVSSWPNRDEAWTNVAKELRRTVKLIREKRSSPPSLPPPSAAEARADDTLLLRVGDEIVRSVAAAEAARGSGLDEAGHRVVAAEVQRMIERPEQTRILWVDDHPENNQLEAAAFAKLQIDVVAERSTDAALTALAQAHEAQEPFDVVISDWSRPWEGRQAGLKLLRRMRQAGHLQPVVFYHGDFDPNGRRQKLEAARAAGGFGEAVLPHELMQLVERALAEAERGSGAGA
jgi:CheY-like chemotaxis protein